MSLVLKPILIAFLLGALAGCQLENEEARNAIKTAQLSENESALIIAAANGDTSKVKEMLDSGVSVDTRDLDVGLTPLAHAAWFGHTDTARLLIERGADINAKKSDGTSVLMIATMRNHKDLADILKKAGAK